MNSSISMLALFSLVTGGWNFDRPLAVATPGNCKWVGRILSVENSQMEAGKLLCAEETLEAEPNAQVTIVCYEKGETLDVPSATISTVGNRCNPPLPILAQVTCDPEGCYADPHSPGRRRRGWGRWLTMPGKKHPPSLSPFPTSVRGSTRLGKSAKSVNRILWQVRLSRRNGDDSPLEMLRERIPGEVEDLR